MVGTNGSAIALPLLTSSGRDDAALELGDEAVARRQHPLFERGEALDRAGVGVRRRADEDGRAGCARRARAADAGAATA